MRILIAGAAESGFGADATGVVDAAMASALPLLKALSVLIIFWGVVCAAVRLAAMEFKVLRRKDYKRDAIAIRQHLGYYLLLSLEFLIAVDVIETMLHPEWKELGILAALVVLRTLMSFSLDWELQKIEQKPQAEGQLAAASNTSGNIRTHKHAASRSTLEEGQT